MKKYISTLVLISLIALTPITSNAQQATSYYSPGVPACINITTTLRYGMRDRPYTFAVGSVSKLQSFLYSSGYLRVQPTGYFGLSTRKAVQAFQRSQRISPTGVVNLATRTAIYKVSCGQQPDTNPRVNIIYPNGGEVWTMGQTYQINWSAQSQGQAQISLEKESEPCYSGYYSGSACTAQGPATYIIANVPLSQGSYSFVLNQSSFIQSDNRTFSTGRYKVRIRNLDNLNIYDVTDGWIQINASTQQGSTIKVVDPDIRPGEWYFGNNYTVRWTYANIPLDTRVYAYLQSSDGNLCLLGTSAVQQGSLSVRPVLGQSCSNPYVYAAGLAAGYYKVFVTIDPTNMTGYYNPVVNLAVSDASDEYFKLSSSGSTNNRDIVVTIRSGNSVYKPGDSISFSWEPNSTTGPLYAYLYNSQGVAVNSRYLVAYGAGDSSIQIPSDMPSGSYRIAVVDQGSSTNISRTGYSSYVNVLVNSSAAWVDLTNPIGGEVWYRNSRQQIRFSSANIPSGAYAVVSLSSTNGGISGVIQQVPVPTSGVLDVSLDSIMTGDVMNSIQPGLYTLTLTIYDRAYCGGFCSPTYVQAQQLTSDTAASITIY